MKQNYILQQFNFNSIITINVVIKQRFGIIAIKIDCTRAFEEIIYLVLTV